MTCLGITESFKEPLTVMFRIKFMRFTIAPTAASKDGQKIP